jgi:predicted RecB family nuclease
MQFRASNTYDLYRPTRCERRVALRYREIPEAEKSEFEKLLNRLGRHHEERYLSTLSEVVDLSRVERGAREAETLAAIRSGVPAIYQARFRALVQLDGETCEIVGEPDFLVRDGATYRIRDSKLARRVGGDHHPEITLQLQLYGWLYRRIVGTPPASLEVHTGTGDIVPVPYSEGEAVPDFLLEFRRMRLAPEETYEPVGWSKCDGCGFRGLCWPLAENARDVALLPHVDQKWARKLHAHGVLNIADLGAAFERSDMRDVFYDKATKKKPERMKDSAASILRSVKAHESGEVCSIGPVEIPERSTAMVLDFEGLPPFIDELEKIYLWGIKDFRAEPARHLFAQAGFGRDGDREGWEAFLRLIASILDECPGTSFIHYGNYEKTKVRLYVDRYGDPSGTAGRLLPLLFDLHPAVTRAVALPVFSYGLKTVERCAGFARGLPEANGAWAMCRYIEATETSDPAARAAIMDQILAYNEEDLDATWAVMEWMRSSRPAHVKSDP